MAPVWYRPWKALLKKEEVIERVLSTNRQPVLKNLASWFCKCEVLRLKVRGGQELDFLSPSWLCTSRTLDVGEEVLKWWWNVPKTQISIQPRKTARGKGNSKGVQRWQALLQSKEGDFISRFLKIIWFLYQWEEHIYSKVCQGMLTKASLNKLFHEGLPSGSQ